MAQADERVDSLIFYEMAKRALECSPYVSEVEQYSSAPVITERLFLAETAWVILNSGFREAVIRSKFSNISLAYFDWESAHLIHQNSKECTELAFAAFGSRRKIQSITQCAVMVSNQGFESFWAKISVSPEEVLLRIPGIGPITVKHLMKNLGFNVPKPDRHLIRCADTFGFHSVESLCSFISKNTGDRVAVVDQVIWRYMASLRH